MTRGLLMKKWIFSSRLLVVLVACCLLSCSRSRPAPVINAWHQPASAGRYRVQRGDTLYSVAFAFGFDYRDIARSNHLKPPYTIKPGDLIVVRKSAKKQRVIHRKKHASPTKKVKDSRKQQKKSRYNVVSTHHTLANPKNWRWPVKAKLLQRFTGQFGRSQGIDIAGWKGRSIVASAPGLVVYSGSGVRGYGNLVIIKHSEEYLSAYAYASRRFVRAGEWVKAGQRIAAMGQDNYGRVRLHFELRRKGKPVNPLHYLR
jgi:lipoprotein NlpD